MKRAAVRAGIQVAHHALLRSAADLDSFVDRHGLPDPATLPEGVVRYTTYAEVGETVPDASHSGDFLAAFVITGADRAETEARIRATESWFRAGLGIG